MYLKIGGLKLATMAATFFSGALAYKRMDPGEFISYVFLQTIVYAANEALCLGGNLESYAIFRTEEETRLENRMQIRLRLLIAMVAAPIVYLAIMNEKIGAISTLLLAITPMLYSTSAAILTQRDGVGRGALIDITVALVGLILRQFYARTQEQFAIMLAIEMIMRGALYTASYLTNNGSNASPQSSEIKCSTLRLNESESRFKTQYFGAALIAQLIANRIESLYFKGDNIDAVALAILVTPPLVTLYYTVEVISNRTKSLAEGRSTGLGTTERMLIMLLLQTTAVAFGAYVKGVLPPHALLAGIVSLLILIDGISFSQAAIQATSFKYAVLSFGRLALIALVISSLNKEVTPIAVIVCAHVASFGFTRFMTRIDKFNK
jgi:hypothetical protein